MKIFLLLPFLLFALVSTAQKKVLDHTVYNDWKSLKNQSISNNGRFVTYEINPHRGDGYLYLFDTKTAVLDSFYRAEAAEFSDNSEYFVYKLTPGFDTLRKCELEKVDKKKWPKDTLVLLSLTTKERIEIPQIKSYSLSKNGSWMAYLIDSTYQQPKPEVVEPKKQGFFARVFNIKEEVKPEVKEKKVSSKGHYLYLSQPFSGEVKEFKNVTEYLFSPKEGYLAFTENEKIDTVQQDRLKIYDLSKKSTLMLEANTQGVAKMNFSENDQLIGYLRTLDTSEAKNYGLKLYDIRDQKPYMTLDSNSMDIPGGKAISTNQSLVFTKNGEYLFFGVSEAEIQKEKDSLLSSEKAKLDLWHYDDNRLQPQQLLELKRDQKKSELYLIQLDGFKIVALENDTMSTRSNANIKGDYLMLSNDRPYQKTYNWTVPNLEDHYRISLKDGEIKELKKAVGMGGQLSPLGKYYTYFNESQAQHYIVEIDANTGSCITCGNNTTNWQSDNNGMPFTPFPYGVIGYNRDETNVYLQSEFDLWSFDLQSKVLTSITNLIGEKNNIELRIQEWDRDSVFIESGSFYIRGFNKKTKGDSFYDWNMKSNKFMLDELYSSKDDVVSLKRSENKSQIILRKQNVKDYPDLYLLDEKYKNETKISNTNPQQSEYNWATVEMIDYTSYDGQELQALLYKPEDFDPNKKYPLMVYFYELYTDRLNTHYIPKPTASIIYASEYASAGYMVLMPDIRYKEGHPGQSAYDCIMASTDKALKLYPNIDSTKMGLQGQSWGGYQTAQLITMTKRYSAAMAGAPVSNMFSAYGGIRWGSGLNRQFQYEKTQSRIGKTIWEAPELYVENSPLFHLPKVTTPLMIMHNDGDGAVPWYQGIELFTGMKRLGKPCWLLNYNGDDHNLMQNANRMDLSIRMRQFFDYYLRDQPAPEWLINGLPATDKGENYRLELIED